MFGQEKGMNIRYLTRATSWSSLSDKYYVTISQIITRAEPMAPVSSTRTAATAAYNNSSRSVNGQSTAEAKAGGQTAGDSSLTHVPDEHVCDHSIVILRWSMYVCVPAGRHDGQRSGGAVAQTRSQTLIS